MVIISCLLNFNQRYITYVCAHKILKRVFKNLVLCLYKVYIKLNPLRFDLNNLILIRRFIYFKYNKFFILNCK